MLALMFLGLGGCTGLAGLEEPPRINLVNIRPVNINLLEQHYLITARIQNPNPVPLAIVGLEYRLGINGKSFADGVSNQHVTIAGYGEKTLDLGIRSTIMQMFEQIKGMADSTGRVAYNIQGHLRLRNVSVNVPFEHRGEVDLRFTKDPKKHSAKLYLRPITDS